PVKLVRCGVKFGKCSIFYVKVRNVGYNTLYNKLFGEKHQK
ncbi:hypothetical protein C5S31_03210, partial [ANME-1 cluster archaeon GoMg2]|nr:hypothetical protein [ANME-1 cluster archaeon GoMg2]